MGFDEPERGRLSLQPDDLLARTAGMRREPQWRNVSESRPLRCVLSLSDPAEPRVAGWLEAMKKAYRLRECRKLDVDMAEPKAKPRTEHYVVYEFVPRAKGRLDSGEICHCTGAVIQ